MAKKRKYTRRSRRKVETRTARPEVRYREVVYVGTADKSTVVGKVTGKKYSFIRNEDGMPISTKVNEKDYAGVISLKGKGCTRRNPQALFILKSDWDLELEETKRVNR